jgi:hypothetical protein
VFFLYLSNGCQGKNNVFQVICDHTNVIFVAESQEDCENWVKLIKDTSAPLKPIVKKAIASEKSKRRPETTTARTSLFKKLRGMI